MTPEARLSAAIEILDRILSGGPVEQTLTNWGRAHRFAGSGDRHALRDLVFDALRCRRSHAALGGGLTGRGLVLGGVRAAGRDPALLFTGVGHAPAPVGPDEMGQTPAGEAALDVPDWLAPALRDSLGGQYAAVMQAMQTRAPVFVRVNLLRADVATAQAALGRDGIVTRPVPWVSTALEVVENERKISQSAAYRDGLIELQDASSQAVVGLIELAPGARVLDYCAGGGGKALALAARGVTVDAHDHFVQRMKELPERAKRAGAHVKIVQDPAKTAPYDVILTDVPCSGSGSWRRDPHGKWALTQERLTEVLQVQSGILDRVAGMLKVGGTLAYVTCSVLRDENEGQVDGFMARHPGWRVKMSQRFSPTAGGDGFFVALLTNS